MAKVRFFRQTHHKHLNILLNINATAAAATQRDLKTVNIISQNNRIIFSQNRKAENI